MSANRLADKESAISAALEKKGLTLPIFYYSDVTSTMDAASSQVGVDLTNAPAIFVADMQTNGRGRQSRTWESEPGNLFVTFLFPVESVEKCAGFSLAAGIAVSGALADLGCRTRLKWPNDILAMSGKKVGGILIEILQKNGTRMLSCGVGINLVTRPPALENVTSVKELCGETYTPSQVVVKLAPRIREVFNKFIEGGFSAYRAEWMQIAAYIGRDVTVHVSKDEKVSGMLLGVGNDGSLQLDLNGKMRVLTAGDLTLNES